MGYIFYLIITWFLNFWNESSFLIMKLFSFGWIQFEDWFFGFLKPSVLVFHLHNLNLVQLKNRFSSSIPIAHKWIIIFHVILVCSANPQKILNQPNKVSGQKVLLRSFPPVCPLPHFFYLVIPKHILGSCYACFGCVMGITGTKHVTKHVTCILKHL